MRLRDSQFYYFHPLSAAFHQSAVCSDVHSLCERSKQQVREAVAGQNQHAFAHEVQNQGNQAVATFREKHQEIQEAAEAYQQNLVAVEESLGSQVEEAWQASACRVVACQAEEASCRGSQGVEEAKRPPRAPLQPF